MIYDYLVIGAGISGSAAACELAAAGSVLLVDAETAPGYHSTGRSAALFTPHFGTPTVQRIGAASRPFLVGPPDGFTTRPLMTARGALTIAPPGQEEGLAPLLAQSTPGKEVRLITADQALALAPLLRPERVAAASHEPGVMDIDVDALHQGYLRGLRQRGGTILCGHRITALARVGGHWGVTAGGADLKGRIIVNAAGAWADQIAIVAGARPVGLVPKRRTAIIVDGLPGIDPRAMPAVDFVATDAYLRPEAGRIMASPGDAEPTVPQDIRPDDLSIAIAADWLQRETRIAVHRIAHSWAGLRSFVADDGPVVGFDDQVPGFFWLAAQGGYGIMMAPALGRATAGLITAGALPPDLCQAGIAAAGLAPRRAM